jgi:beta-glucanase (GH16 family)
MRYQMMLIRLTPSDVAGEWVFDDKPFYIIMNVAVGSYVGPPSENSVFPQTMLVDYVRVYE